ncbi:MAG: endolytic transglycosylase MltG [bacterium]
MHNKNIFYTLGIIILLVSFYFFFFNAPANFPVGAVIRIDKGLGLRSISLKLKNEHIIRSRTIFEAFVVIFGREKNIIQADYYLENKLPVWEIARRVSKGDSHMASISVTIPEGFNVTQIADAVASKLSNFNKNKFLLESKTLEGKLFPDTYFFITTDTEEEVIKFMNENFERKIAPLRSLIISSHKTEKEIITMASIIEREAKGEVDRGFISGILWKRISINMPLQVDVALETYKIKGLPENPIGNPGLASIKSAIYPKSSPYLFYLHDKNGNIHYAKSFAEHRQNVLKYLK